MEMLGHINKGVIFVIDLKSPRSQCLKLSEGRKNEFTTEVVPNICAQFFEGFKPIFNFIQSTLDAS